MTGAYVMCDVRARIEGSRVCRHCCTRAPDGRLPGEARLALVELHDGDLEGVELLLQPRQQPPCLRDLRVHLHYTQTWTSAYTCAVDAAKGKCGGGGGATLLSIYRYLHATACRCMGHAHARWSRCMTRRPVPSSLYLTLETTSSGACRHQYTEVSKDMTDVLWSRAPKAACGRSSRLRVSNHLMRCDRCKHCMACPRAHRHHATHLEEHLERHPQEVRHLHSAHGPLVRPYHVRIGRVTVHLPRCMWWRGIVRGGENTDEVLQTERVCMAL
jgi:hypothetical protein